MSHKRSKQQVIIIKQILSTIIILILLLLIFVFFLSFSIRNIIISNHINSNKLKEYSGMYTISKSHRLRNTIYYIYLENGDVLRITPELLKKGTDFTQDSTLCFMYSEPKSGRESAYTCIAISNTNGNRCYLDCDDSRTAATASTFFGAIMSFLILCLIILYICILLKRGHKGRFT